MPEPVAPALSLGGSLSDFALADVLTFLNMSQVTGAIEVLSDRRANRIYLASGEVVFATSRSPRFALQTFLAARGLLTERTASDLGARAAATGRPIEAVVHESGLVPAEDLASVQKVLCAEIVFDSMRWTEGKFAFLKGWTPPDGTTPLRIGVQNLILEGARRYDEARRMEQEAKIDRGLIATLLCPTVRLEEQLVLTPIEWGVISLINGKRSLEELFTLSPLGSEPETWRILQRLQAARLIQLHPMEEIPTAPEVPAPAPLPRTTEGTGIPAGVSPKVFDPAGEARGADEAARERREKTDVRLLSSGGVTTSRAMFGRRVPARIVGRDDTGEPAFVHELSRPVQTIGRSETSDIVFADASVSKHHAQILQEEEGWRLVDLKSTNGTWVNGERVTERRLLSGDTVRVGYVTFEFDSVMPPPAA